MQHKFVLTIIYHVVKINLMTLKRPLPVKPKKKKGYPIINIVSKIKTATPKTYTMLFKIVN